MDNIRILVRVWYKIPIENNIGKETIKSDYFNKWDGLSLFISIVFIFLSKFSVWVKEALRLACYNSSSKEINNVFRKSDWL